MQVLTSIVVVVVVVSRRYVVGQLGQADVALVHVGRHVREQGTLFLYICLEENIIKLSP